MSIYTLPRGSKLVEVLAEISKSVSIRKKYEEYQQNFEILMKIWKSSFYHAINLGSNMLRKGQKNKTQKQKQKQKKKRKRKEEKKKMMSITINFPLCVLQYKKEL